MLNVYRWITDSSQKRHGIGIGHGSSRIMDIDMVAFLAHCFIDGEVDPESSQNQAPKSGFREFILAFANLSHPLAKRSFHEVFRFSQGIHPNPMVPKKDDSRILLQYHLRYFAPVQADETSMPLSEGLFLVRQLAKIRRIKQNNHKMNITNATTKKDPEDASRDLYFMERALSVSLCIFWQYSTFRVVVLGDSGAVIPDPLNDALDSSKRTGIKPSGDTAGYAQFLAAFSLLLETWYQGWTSTLDAIDNIIGFKVRFPSAITYFLAPSICIESIYNKSSKDEPYPKRRWVGRFHV